MRISTVGEAQAALGGSWDICDLSGHQIDLDLPIPARVRLPWRDERGGQYTSRRPVLMMGGGGYLQSSLSPSGAIYVTSPIGRQQLLRRCRAAIEARSVQAEIDADRARGESSFALGELARRNWRQR